MHTEIFLRPLKVKKPKDKFEIFSIMTRNDHVTPVRKTCLKNFFLNLGTYTHL